MNSDLAPARDVPSLPTAFRPKSAFRRDRLNELRDQNFLRQLLYYTVFDKLGCEIGLVNTKGCLSRRKPAWDRATPVIKMAYAGLAIEEMGYELWALTLNLGPDRIKHLSKKSERLDGQLRRMMSQRLRNRLGYAEFCFAIDLQCSLIMTTRKLIYGRPHIHGFIGLHPEHKQIAKSILKSIAGDWHARGRPAQLKKVERISGWAGYSTRTIMMARADWDGADFACTNKVRAEAKTIFNERGHDLDVARALTRLRVPLKVARALDS
jgi:hypothetical protein